MNMTNATITGHIVKYADNKFNLRIKVAKGVRGINIPCNVCFPESGYPTVYLNGQELVILNVERLPR